MYYLTFTVLCILGLLELNNKFNKQQSGMLLKVVIFWLICHDGLRWATGTDWFPYLQYFNECTIYKYDGFEIGYVLLNKLIRSMTEYYTVFLLVHAMIVYLSLYFVVKYISPYPLLSVFVFYFLMLPLLGMNRQYIALMICIIAFYALTKQKKIVFFALIALAMTFHISAFIFISVYFVNRRFSTTTILIVISLALIIGQSRILDTSLLSNLYFLGEMTSEKFSFYSSKVSSTGLNPVTVILGILKRLLWVLILLLSRKKIERKFQNYDLILNVGCLSVILYLLVANSSLQMIFSRAFIYFGIFEIFTILFALTAFNANRVKKSIIAAVMIIYGLYNIESGMNYYRDSNLDFFNPYNAVYMTNYQSVR